MRTIHFAVLNKIDSLQTMLHTILEIGYGNGEFTKALSATYPRTDITAVDIFMPKSFTSGNITYTKGFVEQLPFDSESFDLVTTVLSLHHWKDKDKGFQEAYRVLKKGGTLIIGDPLLEDWMSNRFWGWLMQVLDGGSFADGKGITQSLNTAGFCNIKIELVPNTMKSLYIITAIKK